AAREPPNGGTGRKKTRRLPGGGQKVASINAATAPFIGSLPLEKAFLFLALPVEVSRCGRELSRRTRADPHTIGIANGSLRAGLPRCSPHRRRVRGTGASLTF